MVSNKDLEDVVAQVNKAYERMNKRITALEEAAKTPKKESAKKT
jgi:chaperonin cofactor prefoldin